MKNIEADFEMLWMEGFQTWKDVREKFGVTQTATVQPKKEKSETSSDKLYCTYCMWMKCLLWLLWLMCFVFDMFRVFSVFIVMYSKLNLSVYLCSYYHFIIDRD